MPAKFTIADEVNDSRVAKIFSDKSLNVGTRYSYYAVVSATATGVISDGPGLLHAVIFNASAAAPSLWLFDNASVANAIGNSASAVARYTTSNISLGSHVYNAVLGSGLTYRLSAVSTDGIVIVYRKD